MLESSDISQSPEDAMEELERLFLFSISWALGGLLEPDERVKFDQYLRQLCPNNMPSLDGAGGAASASDVDSVSGMWFVSLRSLKTPCGVLVGLPIPSLLTSKYFAYGYIYFAR